MSRLESLLSLLISGIECSSCEQRSFLIRHQLPEHTVLTVDLELGTKILKILERSNSNIGTLLESDGNRPDKVLNGLAVVLSNPFPLALYRKQ